MRRDGTMPAMPKTSGGRISYETFRARYGMPDRQALGGVVFRFVPAELVKKMELAGLVTFTVIENPASVRIWAERLAKAAEGCSKHEGQEGECGCLAQARSFTHAADRTVLIAQPVV